MANIDMVDSFKILTKNIVSLFEDKIFSDTELSCSDLSIIRNIYDAESEKRKINVTELSQELKMSKSAVSQTAFKLERKGIIKRNINLFDKKICYFSLTDKAKRMYESKINEYSKMVNKVNEEMGEEDVRKLSSLLIKLSDIVERLERNDEVC